jgi:hypothetical protein
LEIAAEEKPGVAIARCRPRCHEVARRHRVQLAGTAPITWAEAAWDGKNVNVKCRCESNDSLKGEIAGGDQRVPVDVWTSEIGSPLRSACVPWAYTEPQRSLVRLICDRQTMTVVVFDERPSLERQDTLPPEVDKDLGQIMRDELLFEQYGGQIAEDGVNEDTSGVGPDDAEPEADATADGVEKPTTGHVDSYAVPAFVAARKHLGVVDNWPTR